MLDPRHSTHCCVCMSGEFIHVTLLSVFGTVLVDTRALVSNMNSFDSEILKVCLKAVSYTHLTLPTILLV